MANEVNITINAKDLASKRVKKVGAALVAVGAAGILALGSAAKSAANFEKGMREVNTLVNLSEDSLKSLSKETLALSATMGVDAVEATSALYQTISASVAPTEAIEFLDTAMRAAVGGVTDTETAVDGLTTVINAFGMDTSEAGRVADVMFTTVKRGKTTFGELSSSMFQAAPLAAALGVSFEEVAAATASATKSGVPTRVVMTGLRAAMTALAKPTTEMSGLLTDIGHSSAEGAIGALGLQGTLAALMDEAGGTENLVKAGLQAESLSTVLAITGDNAGRFKDDFEAAMNGSAGAADVAFEEMQKSTAFQMEQAKATFEALKITIGTVLLPAINTVIGAFSGVAKIMGDFAAENPLVTKVIVLLAAAISVAALAFGALMLASLAAPVAIGAFGIASSIAAGLSSLLTVSLWAQVAGWIALNIATLGIGVAIAAVVAGIVLLIMNWDEVVRAVKIGINFMSGAIETWANFYIAAINKIIDGINKLGGIFGKEISNISDLEIPRFNTAVEEAAEVVDEASEEIGQSLGVVQTDFIETADVAEDAYEKMGEAAIKAAEVIISAKSEEVARFIEFSKLATDEANRRAGLEQIAADETLAIALEQAEAIVAASDDKYAKLKEQRWQNVDDEAESNKAALEDAAKTLEEELRLEEEFNEKRLKGIESFWTLKASKSKEEFDRLADQMLAMPAVIPAGGMASGGRTDIEVAMRAFKASQNSVTDALAAAQASGNQAEIDKLTKLMGSSQFKGDALGALVGEARGGFGGAPPMLPGMKAPERWVRGENGMMKEQLGQGGWTVVLNGDVYGVDDLVTKISDANTQAEQLGMN